MERKCCVFKDSEYILFIKITFTEKGKNIYYEICRAVLLFSMFDHTPPLQIIVYKFSAQVGKLTTLSIDFNIQLPTRWYIITLVPRGVQRNNFLGMSSNRREGGTKHSFALLYHVLFLFVCICAVVVVFLLLFLFCFVFLLFFFCFVFSSSSLRGFL